MFSYPPHPDCWSLTVEAVAVLEQALEDSLVVDVRLRPELIEALDRLQERCQQPTGVDAFRRALNTPDASTRYEAGSNALKVIRRHLQGMKSA